MMSGATRRSGTALQRGFPGGGIPVRSKSIANYDGTITLVGESYYFVDKSGNDRNLLITGYDFDNTWQKGFPYKSAATISAPADDAAFIAADTTGFWYTDGTPNQIPVTARFPNVDYANHTFLKNIEPTQDYYTELETYEGRIKEIVVYAGLSASEIASCNSYFNVPAKVTGALWVDFITGDDTTGDGTESKPYKTITKVNGLTLESRSIAYVKTGLDALSATIGVSKSYTYKSIGLSSIVFSTNTVINCTANAPYFEGFIISGNTNYYGIRSLSPATGVNISRCYFINCGYGVGTNGDANFIINDNVFASGANGIYNTAAGAVTHNFTRNYFSSALTQYSIQLNGAGGGNFSIKYNKIKKAIFNRYTSNYNIFNNDVEGYLLNGNNQTAATGEMNISYNKIKDVADNQILIYCSATSGMQANYIWNIHNNTISIINNSTGFYFLDQENLQIHDNIIECKTLNKGNCGNIQHSNIRDMEGVIIENNSLISRNSSSPIISIGAKQTADRIKGAKILKNFVLLGGFFGSEGSAHGLAIFNQSGATFKHNYVNGGIGILYKGTSIVNESAECTYNVLHNCYEGVYIKGMQGVPIYNNTFVNDENFFTSFNHAYQLRLGNEEYGGVAKDNIIKNNIFYDSRALTEDTYNIYIDTATKDEDNIIDNNLLYTESNKYSNFGGGSYAEFVAAGYNESGGNQNPNLTPGLWPTTPIKIGADLEGYKTGLDITTDWGSASQVPTVVTKANNDLQIGAYIQ